MMIHSLLIALLATQTPPPTTGDAPDLSVENTTIVRCSAAFALLAQRQAEGDQDATKWPPLGERGKEFFVRAMADMMDDTGYGREAVAQLVSAEARRLNGSEELEQVMPACLLMLDGSGI